MTSTGDARDLLRSAMHAFENTHLKGWVFLLRRTSTCSGPQT